MKTATITLLQAINEMEKRCLSSDSKRTTAQDIKEKGPKETREYFHWLKQQTPVSSVFIPDFDTLDYSQLRRDFETLEAIMPLEDQVELDGQRECLMQNPTKETAAKMYRSAIQLWLDYNTNKLICNASKRATIDNIRERLNASFL